MATPVPAVTSSRPVEIQQVDDVLVLVLDPDASFEILRENLRKIFSEKQSLHAKDARLDLGARNIDLFDLRRLVHVLKEEFKITVAGVYCTESALHRYAERELKLCVYTRADPVAEDPEDPEEGLEFEPTEALAPKPDPMTPLETGEPGQVRPLDPMHSLGETQKLLTVARSLRSGQLIRFSGDVVIYGDVNPGAEILAGGNILVFGALKGLAHAGARGNEGALILALDFRPTQLRIGRKIALAPDKGASSHRSSGVEIAWIRGGQIVIEPYQGHLPQIAAHQGVADE